MAKTKMTDDEKKARRAERRKARKAAADAAIVTETASEKTKKSRRSKKVKTDAPVEEIQFVTINGHEVSKEIAERNVTVICEPVKPKKKAEPKKYPNGEYVPEPKNFTQLKKYVTTYFRAMKWKNREGDYTFPESNIHIRDFKLTKLKANKAVRVEFKAVILTPKTMLAKSISKDYTLENHKQVRTDIIHVYREVKNTKLVAGDKVKEKELLKRNWSKVY